MGIQVGDNFDHKSKKPLDNRTQYATIASMKAVADANINEGCIAYCVATDKYYKFLSTNTVDESTGKWREYPNLDSKADLVNGKVPESQLPSYVDDVIDGYYKTADGKFYEESTYETEIPGESGKIYISLDTSIQYRWTGSAFSALGGALTLGETSSTAYRGDRGKTAYDHSQTTGNPHGTTKSDIGLGSVENTGDSATPTSGGTSKFTTGGAYTQFLKRDKSIPFYCTCSTAASTTSKSVSSAETSLVTSLTTGMRISVKFTYSNTSSAPTLTLGSLTAKNIKYVDSSGTVTTPTKWWGAGDIVEFVYDGTQWLMQPTISMAGCKEMAAADMEEIIDPLPGITPKWHTYSTEEQAIGKWINGKTIYEKTISTGTLPNATSKTVATNVANIERVVNMFGYAFLSQRCITLPYPLKGYECNIDIRNITSSGANIMLNCAGNLSDFTESYVTIQYTKTS